MCRRSFRTSKVAAVFSLAIACSALARADSIYTYTGNDFKSFEGNSGDTTSNFISIILDFAGTLAINTSYGPIDPVSWSITDGTHTLSSADGDFIEPSSITTGAGDNILFWSLAFSASDEEGDPILQTANIPFGPQPLDMFTLDSNDTASITGSPGTWVESTTPEPGTIILAIAGGIPVLIGGYRRRRALD